MTLSDGYLANGYWSATETLQTRVRATAVEDPQRIDRVSAESAWPIGP